MIFINIQYFKENLNVFINDLKYDEKAKNTYQKYQKDIQKFLAFMKIHEGEVTKDDLFKYRNFLKEQKYKVSSINGYLVSINKYIKWLRKDEHKDVVKKDLIKTLKVQQKTTLENVLSPVDYKRLERVSKKRGIMDTHYIIKVLGYSGIRVEELKFITVESITLKSIELENKGKIRQIVLPMWLLRELRSYCKENGIERGYVFHSTKKGYEEKMINNSTVWRKLKRVAGFAKVSLDVVYPHSFRHMFAKRFLELHNGDYVKLANVLGHNDIKTTAIYTLASLSEKRKDIEEFRY